jgi:dTDP-4-dehydrorhamnose 3,5-epimerase
LHGVLRGLHFQLRQPQGKLVSVALGEIYDVAVDIRINSPTFGRWVGYIITSVRPKFIFIPEGFAHGFCVLSETAIVNYKCTDYYAPKEERGIRWNDPSVGITWPVSKPILSEKDSRYPAIDNIGNDNLPKI